MNLTQFSIEKNRVVLSILLVIIVFGVMLYQTLSRDSMPPIPFGWPPWCRRSLGPVLSVLKKLVTDKIEKVAQELPELKNVKSTRVPDFRW